MQGCITIGVFTIIVGLLFRQMPRWNNSVSFLLVVAAVYSLSISKSEVPLISLAPEPLSRKR